MSTRLAARADRERQIVAATRLLFDEQGVQEAAIDGVARAVGINKALIYRHVASKEELFILVLISYLGELRDGFPEDRSDPVAALRESIDRYTAFCLEYPAFLDCALSLMRRPARELAQRVSEGTWFRLGRAMAECLGPLADLVRAAGVEDPEYVANRIYVQVLGTMGCPASSGSTPSGCGATASRTRWRSRSDNANEVRARSTPPEAVVTPLLERPRFWV